VIGGGGGVGDLEEGNVAAEGSGVEVGNTVEGRGEAEGETVDAIMVDNDEVLGIVEESSETPKSVESYIPRSYEELPTT
jgi:hypothetical protein